MVEAIKIYYSYGLNPGSYLYSCLKNGIKESYHLAHQVVKNVSDGKASTITKDEWEQFCSYIENLPEECKGDNVDSWVAMNGYHGEVPEEVKMLHKLKMGKNPYLIKIKNEQNKVLELR